MEKPHDWRVFWCPDRGHWVASRWDGVGGICLAVSLEVHAPFETRGRYMLFKDAEAKIGTLTWIQNEDVRTTVLRIVPRTQEVAVSTVRVKASGRRPR